MKLRSLFGKKELYLGLLLGYGTAALLGFWPALVVFIGLSVYFVSQA